jgi:hypothetical protein
MAAYFSTLIKRVWRTVLVCNELSAEMSEKAVSMESRL